MRSLTVIITIFLWVHASAQESITLFECHKLATEHAPRLADREIIRQMGSIKVDQATMRWYPSLDLHGRLSYQSDVVTVTLTDPMIPVEFPQVPHDQYGLNLDISQTLYDGGMTRQRKQYEETQVAADLQQVEVDLYNLKEKVNQLYFAILLLQENRKNLEIHLSNLEARHETMESAMALGTLLESDLQIIEVEMLKVKKSMVEVDSRRDSYMDMLQLLCGEEFHDGVVLEMPIFGDYNGEAGLRPEYRLFDLKDASMEAGKELLKKQRMPLLYAFGQTGYGKPGYNMLSGEWDFYYMVGAGLRWKIWDWNLSARERQLVEHQRNMLKNQRASFDMEMESRKVQEEARIKQYKKSMEMEEQVLKLQQEISKQAATKLANGTITATAYITELNKEILARITLATHQVKLMQSTANYLTIEGNL